ncbi:hypothetical protein Pyn_33206 [Prunus yedoensis var. nudiflora]|uniref:Uncharacterized protein n=1 Tax=Prunus yedoensis var. nudiflora TaxID=2094558 RepID=A0A314ZI19_PRUYE|nr:hypothetical protein Pyn_33206 [Prunus yedoensis var. nudiflora]
MSSASHSQTHLGHGLHHNILLHSSETCLVQKRPSKVIEKMHGLLIVGCYVFVNL